MTETSLDSHSRDWFFPSSSFLNTTPPKTLNASKKLSTFPSPKRRPPKPYSPFSRPRSRPSPPPAAVTAGSSSFSYSNSFASSSSSAAAVEGIPRRDARYPSLRRRVDFGRRFEDQTGTSDRAEKPEVRKGSGVPGGDRRWRVRWPLALSVAVTVMCFSSLLHKNFALHSQVRDLQDELSSLQSRLRACNLFYPMDATTSFPLDSDHTANQSLKNSALFISLALLSIPLIVLKYVDHVSNIRQTSDNALEEVSLSKRLAYQIDVFFSVRPYAKPLALLLATLLLIFLGGLALFGVMDDSLADCLWLSWTYVADSGNHASSVGLSPKLVSVSISFGGMLIFAMMLGLVSDAISEKFDSLRKGRSEVIEKDHTLILGWSDKMGSLLNQLAIANESLGGGTIVVMAERDKEEMEIDIAKMEFDLKGTSVICRSGSPLILADLKKVSVSKARAVIVLAEDGNADQSDARALRTVLSLTGVKEGLKGHIVVELSDLDNEVLVKLVGGDLVETVVAHDVIGRLMIQCARQPGLAQIWEDILGFENCEFYIKRWPQLDEMRFEDVLISFPEAIPCGVKVAARGGIIILNPDDSYVLHEGDEILVIAEDDDTYTPTTTMAKVRRGYPPKDFVLPKSSEKILFCGWRRDMEDMIMVLDAFLAPGSELWMFNEVPENDRERKLIEGGLDISRLENIRIENREGNAVIRRHLESLPLEEFDSILILADESVEDSAVQADSRSLATLLLIRDIQAKRLPYREAMVLHSQRGSFSQGSWIGEMQQASDKTVIISEILDPRTKNLLSMSKISDYVLSNELVSMALAMVAEDRQINDVLEELFAEEGNEMHLRLADLYLREDEELSFYEIMLRARQRREIVIGYRLASEEKAVINPPSKDVRQNWSLKDVFVVIAEKE
ncbi:putative ion channel CASTOR [Acorus calamus]|uniref:Ion channel CASTOR n=1 Tax=Acorus calamus TaxID=4465 RepID=A0AAV9EZ01_ACOCL|nr:putative ion channel CASTOR [Acorus calamus]